MLFKKTPDAAQADVEVPVEPVVEAPKADPATADPAPSAPAVEAPVADAPAEAPAKAPAAEAAEPVEAKEEAPEFDESIWGTTGSEVGDSVLRLLNDGGVDPDQAKSLMYDAIQDGRPEDIDRDALVEKVGKDRATLIMAGVNNFVNARASAQAAQVAAVYKAAGSRENWETMLPWVNSLPAEQAAEYSGLIDQGGLQAKLAVQDLVVKYNADPKTKSLAATEIVGDASAGAKGRVDGISQSEYGRQLLILNKRNIATPAALQDLKARRAAGKKAGI